MIQYELLTENPYRFGHEELIWEVYVRQNEIPAEVLETEGKDIRSQLFFKEHSCLRASALVKRYGFGAHYNEAGKIALYASESEAYKTFTRDSAVKILAGMRTKKA